MDIFFFFLFIFLLCISKHINRKITNKNLPPCPLTLPIIGHLHLLYKPLHQSLAQFSHRYGPILLLQFGSRPALVQSKNASPNMTKHLQATLPYSPENTLAITTPP
ncbi:cytochrome P450 81E8-like protein [Cinnamomum micranthum f. kanehirae]|uniref:Cytochrome P450 81E8-like protein n=1 Tax=Cinnamomum micranthum f. kanehirae TaxID=337451 RepID=A0A3S3P337_9MAGN|nr:cytochrome P450 81E8-like protein [Cinnamomum micranthum f. kanehirae]